MFKRKYLFIGIVLSMVFALLSIFIADNAVTQNAETKNFQSVDNIAYNRVGLLLGTGKYTQFGTVNLYYKYRIQAAERLFKAGKVSYFLVSGDNSRKGYDEPSDIKADLIAKGVPAQNIILDYAGFRTLDSIVRAKEIFGQSNITIISQKFHNERAIYLAEKYGMTAIGFNAKDVSRNYSRMTQLREKLARVKMMLDILMGVKPKFLGEKIVIG